MKPPPVPPARAAPHKAPGRCWARSPRPPECLVPSTTALTCPAAAEWDGSVVCCRVDPERDRLICVMHTRLKGLPFSDGEFFAVSGGEVVDNAQVPRFLWAGGALQGIRCVLIKYLLWTWCLYSYLASCGGGGVLQLADFCIKKQGKN